MNKDGTRDLAWWRISAWASSTATIVTLLMSWLVLGAVYGLMYGPGVTELLSAFLLGLVVLMFLGGGERSPQRIAPLWWREWATASRGIGILGFASAFPCGFLFGLLLVSRKSGYLIWFGAGSCFGLVFGLIGALLAGLIFAFPGPKAEASPLSPRASWRQDQIHGLVVWLLIGVVMALMIGLFFAAVVSGADIPLSVQESGKKHPGFPGGFAGAFADGFASVLAVGLLCALAYPETWSASHAFLQLAILRRIPIRLMRFLEDARERGILRTVGPLYQLRHARLQDRLAEQAKPKTSRKP